MNSVNSKVRPIHEIRLGRIRAAIWENESPNGMRHNVSITRSYRDGQQWKDSTSFGREDLLLLAKVADQAHSWIFAHEQESSATGN